MWELILAVSFAIMVSAGCSLFEAVLYAAPKRHIETLAHAGKTTGKIFKRLRDNVDRPIAAILFLNTIANTAGAAFAGSAASAVFGHRWLVYFSAAFTLTILVASEIIPKTAGVVYARPLLPWVAYPLKGLVWAMTPAVWLISFITRLVAGRQTEEAITANELQVMARLSMQRGAIKPYQKRIIENILTLQNRTVREVMTPRTVVFALSEHLTLEEAGQKTKKWEHSRFPVFDEGLEDVVGIVLTKELLMAISQGQRDKHLTELMRPVHFVVESASLNRVLMEFLELKQHLFVVLDEYGGLSGLVTLEDILEDILGAEIVDESDEVEDKRALARMRRSSLLSPSE